MIQITPVQCQKTYAQAGPPAAACCSAIDSGACYNPDLAFN